MKILTKWKDLEKDPRITFAVAGKGNHFWAYLNLGWYNALPEPNNPNAYWGAASKGFVYGNSVDEVLEVVNNHLKFVP